MKNVAILGCGPAGLLAAHAAELCGHKPVIFSAHVKSVLGGAQFIHEPIPGLTGVSPDSYVTFKKAGTREGYAEKVYGNSGAPCSWEEFAEGEMPMWSMSLAYDRLWNRFSKRIINRVITGAEIESIAGAMPGTYEPKTQKQLENPPPPVYSLIISTIPAPIICRGGHEFEHAEIWIRNFSIGISRDDDPTIIYNGEKNTLWYRTSLIGGQASTEYADKVEGARVGKKPLDTDCDCRPNVLRVGRFGKWKKGVLVHHAFKESIDAIEKL